MRPGTRGFNGSRLKLGREARGLTTIALADLVGITKQAISAYEAGQKTPSPHVMRRISEVLRIPAHYFLMQSTPGETDAIFNRSMESTTKSSRLRAEGRYRWLRDLVHYLRPLVQFPVVNFPSLDLPCIPTEIRDRDIDDAATATRRFWGLGDKPISNVAWLVENNGAIMSRHEFGSDFMDAFSQWNTEEATPYFVLNSEKGCGVRSRYDVAHELGHMVLHRGVPEELLRHKSIFKLIETQAHRFAGSFLLPETTFAAEFDRMPTLDHFVPMKLKWKASIQFMVMRSEYLGIISKETKSRMFSSLSARGWRKQEPYDDSIDFERPRFLRRSIELLVKNQMIAPNEIPFRLGIGGRDLEDIAGLDHGFFEDDFEEPTQSIDSTPPTSPNDEETEKRSYIFKFPNAQ